MVATEVGLKRNIQGLVEEGAAFEMLGGGLTRPARSIRSRRFHVGMAIAFFMTALAGFGPSYYAKSVTPPAMSPLVQVHALVFTGWLVLLLVQTTLVATRRVAVHRNLGIFGAALATTMIPLGLLTAVAAARTRTTIPVQDNFGLLFFQASAIAMFAGFIGAALWNRRRRPEFHRRLIMLATICLMPAAIARFSLIGPRPVLAMLLSMLFVVAGILHDRKTRGRAHPVYVWGGLAILVSGPLRHAFGQTGVWQDFARYLVG